MSDIERTRGLLGTDDPEVWAEEFTRIFNVSTHAGGDDIMTTDGQVELMLTWFTNFAETVIRLRDERRERLSAATEHVPDTAREAFVEGVDDGRRYPEA